jgi:NTE family protein
VKRQAFFLTFFVVLALAQTALAQRVALVFSGGGAKGLAYIGALKALEENGIPIDYVMGTSIGGLVGGFYAAGYSPQDMERIATSSQFQNWAAGKLEEEDKISIFQQMLEDPTMVSFRVGLDTAFVSNVKANMLIKDQVLNLGLMEQLFAASAKANYNFDSLVIPFRCMASEILTQQEVVLSKGHLNQALRATMAVPLFFAPQKVDGMYLFDGGLYNNFPVNKAKEIFKPDVVIGFNVSDKIFSVYPYASDELYVDSKLLTYLMLSKSDTAQLESGDIYIQPEVQAYSSTDFTAAKQLIAIGYAETMAKIPLIKANIHERRDSIYYDQRRTAFLAGREALLIDKVEVRGFKNAGELEQYFKPDTSDHYTIKAIRDGYFSLAQSGAYDRFSPTLDYQKDREAYQFNLNLKHNKDLKIGLGGMISNRPISYLFLSLEKDFFTNRRYNVYSNGYIGVFYLSNYTRARVYFPSYNASYLEGSLTYNNWDFYQTANLFQLGQINQSFLRQNEVNAKLSLKTAVKKKGIAGLSAGYVNSQSKYSVISAFLPGDTLSNSRIRMFQGRGEYSHSKLNRIQYPSKGYYLQVDANYYAGTEEFTPGTLEKQIARISISQTYESIRDWFALQVKGGEYFRIKDRYTIGVSFQTYFSNQTFFFNRKATAFYAKPFMPIMDSYTHYYEDFRSSNFIAGGLTNIFTLGKKLDLRAEVYPYYNLLPVKSNSPGGGVGIDGQYYGTEPELRFVAAAGMVYHFFLGPIALQATYYDTEVLGESKLGFVVHAGFLLRNKRWDD